MKEAIETAIKSLAEQSTKEDKASEAMQRSQAALNLAHALAILMNIPKP